MQAVDIQRGPEEAQDRERLVDPEGLLRRRYTSIHRGAVGLEEVATRVMGVDPHEPEALSATNTGSARADERTEALARATAARAAIDELPRHDYSADSLPPERMAA